MKPRRGFVGVMHVCFGLDGYRSFLGADWPVVLIAHAIGQATETRTANGQPVVGRMVEGCRRQGPSNKTQREMLYEAWMEEVCWFVGASPPRWVLTNGGAGRLCWLRMELTSWKKEGRC